MIGFTAAGFLALLAGVAVAMTAIGVAGYITGYRLGRHDLAAASPASAVTEADRHQHVQPHVPKHRHGAPRLSPVQLPAQRPDRERYRPTGPLRALRYFTAPPAPPEVTPVPQEWDNSYATKKRLLAALLKAS